MWVQPSKLPFGLNSFDRWQLRVNKHRKIEVVVREALISVSWQSRKTSYLSKKVSNSKLQDLSGFIDHVCGFRTIGERICQLKPANLDD